MNVMHREYEKLVDEFNAMNNMNSSSKLENASRNLEEFISRVCPMSSEMVNDEIRRCIDERDAFLVSWNDLV
jgi:hypothetical protein